MNEEFKIGDLVELVELSMGIYPSDIDGAFPIELVDSGDNTVLIGDWWVEQSAIRKVKIGEDVK